MSPPTSLIAAQNDRFRAAIHIPQFGLAEIPGRLMITRGIAALPPTTQIEIIAAVRTFDTSTGNNDPYGEHDFGSFEHDGAVSVFWKIDYYDRDCSFGSPDPADPFVTCRVLTIMLAEEY